MDFSAWEIVVDGDKLWLGAAGPHPTDPTLIRLEPVLQVWIEPETTANGRKWQGATYHVTPVLDLKPPLPRLDVPRARTRMPIREMGDRQFWETLIRIEVRKLGAQDAGILLVGS